MKPTQQRARVTEVWPWAANYDKQRQHGRRRRLVIAGVLSFVKLERLDRLEAQNGPPIEDDPDEPGPF